MQHVAGPVGLVGAYWSEECFRDFADACSVQNIVLTWGLAALHLEMDFEGETRYLGAWSGPRHVPQTNRELHEALLQIESCL